MKVISICYDPPGTGKTLLARAVANQTDVSFIHVIGSELVQKYVGAGARMVTELFQVYSEGCIRVTENEIILFKLLLSSLSYVSLGLVNFSVMTIRTSSFA